MSIDAWERIKGMNDYLIIDAHLHTYKTPAIGRQALSGWDGSGCSGAVEELLPIMRQAGISKAVQVNMTPARTMLQAALGGQAPEKTPDIPADILEKVKSRIVRRNEWTCLMARQHPELAAFISLDPLMGPGDMLAELIDKIENHGALGLKIHPGEGYFFPDDRALWPVYEYLEKNSLAVISHGGPDLANPDPDYSRPKAFGPVLEKFPALKLVSAHLGRGFLEEAVEIAGRYPNIYFDTSAAISGVADGTPMFPDNGMTNQEAVEHIRHLGTDRVFFGSDFPWFHPEWDLKRFMSLEFTDEEKRGILGQNARRVLGV